LFEQKQKPSWYSFSPFFLLLPATRCSLPNENTTPVVSYSLFVLVVAAAVPEDAAAR
jgi:hypothetical protein